MVFEMRTSTLRCVRVRITVLNRSVLPFCWNFRGRTFECPFVGAQLLRAPLTWHSAPRLLLFGAWFSFGVKLNLTIFLLKSEHSVSPSLLHQQWSTNWAGRRECRASYDDRYQGRRGLSCWFGRRGRAPAASLLSRRRGKAWRSSCQFGLARVSRERTYRSSLGRWNQTWRPPCDGSPTITTVRAFGGGLSNREQGGDDSQQQQQ